MSLNNHFKQEEEATPVDRMFLQGLRNRLLEQQSTRPAMVRRWQWLPITATAGIALALAIGITTFTQITPLTPPIAFASAFNNTFGSSMTDFFFTGEGRHMQWSMTRFGQFEGQLEIWKLGDNFRSRFTDELTTYDSIQIDDQRCTFVADLPGTSDTLCEDVNNQVAQDITELEKAFAAPEINRLVTVTPVTDETYHVEGWVIAWETDEPYTIPRGDINEAQIVDDVTLQYAEGPRSYGSYDPFAVTYPNIALVHSVYDVVNQPNDSGYRHAGFFSMSINNLEYGLTFQIIENGKASELYHYTPENGLVEVANRDELFARFATQASYNLPVDSRMFEALYFAREADAFTTPLETYQTKLEDKAVTYYRFAASSSDAAVTNIWKKQSPLDEPDQTFEFWVDNDLGKIIKYRTTMAGESIATDQPGTNDQWEATLLVDEVFNGPLNISQWASENKD